MPAAINEEAIDRHCRRAGWRPRLRGRLRAGRLIPAAQIRRADSFRRRPRSGTAMTPHRLRKCSQRSLPPPPPPAWRPSRSPPPLARCRRRCVPPATQPAACSGKLHFKGPLNLDQTPSPAEIVRCPIMIMMHTASSLATGQLVTRQLARELIECVLSSIAFGGIETYMVFLRRRGPPDVSQQKL